MKVLVVGCGKVGSEIARDLARDPEVDSVVASDTSPENLRKLKGIDRIATRRLDISQKNEVRRAMQNADVVCGALPGRIGFQVMAQAVQNGRNVVDISYTPENPFRLHQEARRKDVVVVPQCGVAPGFTNMCVGDAHQKLGKILRIRIYVGGLPQKPVPPLNYRVVFSLDDVINEYSRPVHVISNGRKELVEPLSGRGTLSFPGVGKLEYFLTDGLGSLPRSFPKVRDMFEYTLRYPGHADMMETLRVLGFFDRRRVPVDRYDLEPRALSVALLKESMSLGAPEDLLALRVEVEGKNGRSNSLTYQVIDYYNSRSDVSAMARTTAYPCTSAAIIVGKNKVSQRGVVPPETIARDKGHFLNVLERLKKRGVQVKIKARVS